MNKSSIQPYILLDTGHCRKLEQVGHLRIIRPALNAFWRPTLLAREWDAADAVFERQSTGGGVWTWKHGLRQPAEGDWIVRWGEVNFMRSPPTSATSDSSPSRSETGRG